MATRWGICTAGDISNDFCGALKVLSPEDHKIVAVAARDKKKAEEFAERVGIPKAYGSYEELAKDDEVDIAYVGSINSKHKEQCLMFLEHGKHVLCEKPMTLSLKDAEEVIRTAREKKLFFMEATWMHFFPVYDHLRKELLNGTIGDPLVVNGRFCLSICDVERIKRKELGGGGLMDIGLYLINAAYVVFKGRPEKISVEHTKLSTGVDANGTIYLKYSNGGVASLMYDIRFDAMPNYNNLLIGGSKGVIQIDSPFWCPTRLTTPQGEFEFPVPKSDFPFNFSNSTGLCYEADAVRQCLKKGEIECPLMSHEMSLTIMSILEDILKQMDISFD